VFLAVVLPKKWFRDGFVYKGFLVMLVASVGAILLQKTMGNSLPDKHLLYQWAGLAILIMVCLILLFHNIPLLQRAVIFFIDKFEVMTYIYVPIGVISLLVVILRNLS